MSVTIRRAREGDAPAIAYILCEGWKSGYKEIIPPGELEGSRFVSLEARTAQFEKILANPQGETVLLAELDGRAVGMTACAAARDEGMSGYGEVIAIYTLPDCWGNGVGSALMTAALDELGSSGYKRVLLWVFSANDRARRFYEKQGFAPDGIEKPSAFTDALETRYSITLQ